MQRAWEWAVTPHYPVICDIWETGRERMSVLPEFCLPSGSMSKSHGLRWSHFFILG